MELKKRPRGRAPKDKVWNYILGKWVNKSECKTVHKRPRGAAPKGKMWNYASGTWANVSESPENSPCTFRVRRNPKLKKDELTLNWAYESNGENYWKLYNKKHKTEENWKKMENMVKYMKEKRKQSLRNAYTPWLPNNV